MAIDEATEIQILKIDGLAALSKPLDGTLRVFLLTDTPEVREAVLQVIGDKLPTEKVVFESQKSAEQCSFCGKMQKEVRKLVSSPTAVILSREEAFTVCICDECVAVCAKLIQEGLPN